MRLDVPLVDRLVAELHLDYYVSRSETLVDVTLGVLDMGGDVALFVRALAQFGGGQVFVEQRCVVGHGLIDCHYRL